MAGTIYGLPSDGSVPAAFSALLDVGEVDPSSFLVKGTTVALVGDSITDGAGSTNTSVDSYRAYLPKILGGDRIVVSEHGVPGDAADDVLSRLPAILAENLGAVVLMVGTNPSIDLASYRADMEAIVAAVKDKRVPLLLCTVPAKGSGATDAASHQSRTNVYNLFLRRLAAREGLPLADVFTATVDPATGYLRTAYDQDGTHPTPAGHLAIAKTVAAELGKMLPTFPPLVTAPGAPGLIANPLMAGGSATTAPTDWGASTGVPTNATISVGTEPPVEGDLLTAGDWFRITVDGTAATGSSTYVRHHNFSPVPAEGDVILVTALVKSAGTTEPRVVLQLNDGATVRSIVGEKFGVPNPGTVQRVYTISPAFTSSPRVRVGVTASAGTIETAYVGAVQAYNLTAMGLADAFA